MTSPSARRIRVAIADDHPLMRAALKDAVTSQIDGAVAVEAASVSALFDALAAEPDTDVVLLDLRMPDSKGFSALVSLRTHHPHVPVIVVSATEDADTINRALLLGASGYIVKSAPTDAVVRALLEVMQGHVVRPLPDSAWDAVREEEVTLLRKLRTLTPQQFNVLVIMAEGQSNKAVAAQLHITEATVKAHITAILLKLGLQRRTQAALMAQRALQIQGWGHAAELPPIADSEAGTLT